MVGWVRERERGVVKHRAELARRERSSSLDDEEERGGVRAAAASNKGERMRERATH